MRHELVEAAVEARNGVANLVRGILAGPERGADRDRGIGLFCPVHSSFGLRRAVARWLSAALHLPRNARIHTRIRFVRQEVTAPLGTGAR